MKLETAVALADARQCLVEAIEFSRIGFFRVAIREAYLVAHHAARAAIFEHAGIVGRTHAGVRTQFAKLAQVYGGADSGATKFLADAYAWKETADYQPATATARFDQALADEAIIGATRLVETVERVIHARGDEV